MSAFNQWKAQQPAPQQQTIGESKPMNVTMKKQLQILTFADAGWEIERKYKLGSDDVWFPHGQDEEFDFRNYHYRVVLPPLLEGYDLVPLGTEVKGDSKIIWLTVEEGRRWIGGPFECDFVHDKPQVIYAVKRQPTYLERHKASGLKVGDKVRVTRRADCHESGWENSWLPHYSDWVGKVFEITDDCNESGFCLESRVVIPYFVLEKVTTKEAPLTAGDLPKGAGLWLELGMSIYQVMEIKPDGVITRDGSFWRFTSIHEKRGRFSVDRETWVNGWKEAEL